MPTQSALANIYIGVEPPLAADATTRWISQSMRHAQVPHDAYSRTPIIGSGVGQSATQEISPWYNEALHRYECLVNVASAQYFSYAYSPLGPWSTPVKVLGQNTGGESSNSQQCFVLVEGTTLYAFYLTGASATSIQMATAQMPTTVDGTPAFSKNGTVFTEGAVINETPCVIKVNGAYYLFTANQAAPRIAKTTATSPANFVATPFAKITTQLRGLYVNQGVRYGARIGRPQVFYENGTWIMYGHLLDGVDFGTCNVYRFTCNDIDLPINWVADTQKPFLEQKHPLEVDQIADFRIFQGPNERNWAFWTAADNPGVAFSIMAAPVLEPIMAFDGHDWAPTSYRINDANGQGYINPDAANADQVLGNLWDIFFRTEGGAKNATFPVASTHRKVKVTNAPSTPSSVNPVKLIPANATDVIMGGNPITAMSAVGTTVTVTTKRPHGLATGEFVTVTGAAPSSYNASGVEVASVPAADQFTYTAGSSPAANTTLGCFDRALLPGETGRWRCRYAGVWVRD